MRRAIALLALLLTLGPPIYRAGRDPATVFSDPLALSPTHVLHIAVWLIAGMALVPILSLHAPEVLKILVRRPIAPYAGFAALAVLSVAYADAKLYAGFEAIRFLVGLGLGIVVVNLVPSGIPRAIAAIEAACSIGAGAELLLMLIEPSLVGGWYTSDGVQHFRLTGGIFGDYGGFAVVAGFAALRRTPAAPTGYSRLAYRLAYAASWVLVGLSRTRTAFVAAALGAVVVLWVGREAAVRLRAVWWLSLGSLVAMAIGLADELGAFLRRGQTMPEIVTLTGRVIAFRYLMAHWRGSPLVGFGYASGSRLALLGFMTTTGMGIGQAHDVLSRALVDLGIAGATLLLLTVGMTSRSVWRLARRARCGAVDRRLAAGLLGILVWQLVWSVTGPGIAAPSFPFAVALVALQRLDVPPARAIRSDRGTHALPWRR